MKRITFIVIITLLLSTFLITSCATTGRSHREIQEDFNESAIYFIKTDGETLVKYLNDDTSLTLREKQATKRRYKNLLDIIAEMEAE